VAARLAATGAASLDHQVGWYHGVHVLLTVSRCQRPAAFSFLIAP
jgi:hypothetical protein